MNNPAFSVIVPTFNRASSINRTIESVLKQTFMDFELIIVDDGSTDHTRETISSLNDSRVRYFYQENKGRSAARNAGANRSNGKYLVFLDSDDDVLPAWLHRMAQALEDSTAGIVCCGYLDVLETEDERRQNAILPNNRGPMYCDQKCMFRCGTFALHRDLFDAVGGYTEELVFSENTELAIRLVPQCIREGRKVIAIDEALLIYHRRPSRRAKTPEDFIVLLRSANLILERHGARLREKFPPGYANYCAIAGVNAARLGRGAEARHFFASAISNYPYRVANYGRLFLTMFPSLARKLWLRHGSKLISIILASVIH